MASRLLLLTSFAAVVIASPAMADYTPSWLPDWSAEPGYTSQSWGLHAVGGVEPTQPLPADNYSTNPYGTATATWDRSTYIEMYGMRYVQWLAEPMGTHPSWVDEVYGGMVDNAESTEGGTYGLHIAMPAVAGSGSLKVFVQYDWYAFGGEGASTATPSVIGAADITPGAYYDVELGRSDSDTPWYRTTRVFEFDTNPGAFDVDLMVDGAAPMIDSVSITTALDATAPQTMPIPEPATLGVLTLGGLALLRRRARQ
jgi:hypothetical protein